MNPAEGGEAEWQQNRRSGRSCIVQQAASSSILAIIKEQLLPRQHHFTLIGGLLPAAYSEPVVDNSVAVGQTVPLLSFPYWQLLVAYMLAAGGGMLERSVQARTRTPLFGCCPQCVDSLPCPCY